MDLADACLVCLADEFGAPSILTLDQDFAIYRWGKNKPIRLLLARAQHRSTRNRARVTAECHCFFASRYFFSTLAMTT
jgi:hypothetical protein